MSDFGKRWKNPMRALGIFSGAVGDPLATAFGSVMDSFLDDGESGRDTTGDVAFRTGELLRKQFEDWQKTFMPIELQALKQISMNNPEVLPAAIEDTEKTVQGSFGAMRGVLERQNNALGIQPTEGQTTASKRLLNLGEASTMASAKNATRANVRQMDEAILMGATPNPNIAKAKPGVTG